MKHRLIPILLVLACDSKPPADAKAAPPPEEPVLCGLPQAHANEAMLALSKCTAKASALDSEESPELPDCDTERTTVVAASESFLECIDNQWDGGSYVAVAVKKMRAFAEDMCACKDKACADKVTGEMVKFGEDMSKKYAGKPEPKISETHKQEMDELMKRFTECTLKAMGG